MPVRNSTASIAQAQLGDAPENLVGQLVLEASVDKLSSALDDEVACVLELATTKKTPINSWHLIAARLPHCMEDGEPEREVVSICQSFGPFQKRDTHAR
jgi:hypothetical protein